MSPYRKRTLRRMAPTTRKLAKLVGELESVRRRLINLVEEVSRLELDSHALQAMNKAKVKGKEAD